MTSWPAPSERSFCDHCGSPLSPTATVCGNCGAELYAQAPPQPPAPQPQPQPVAPAWSRPAEPVPVRPPVPSGPPLRLGIGESIWRRYKVTQLRHASRGEGTLYVTNARVIFHGVAHPRGTRRGSVVIQETRVEGVTGLTVHRAQGISLGLYIALVIFGLAALAQLAAGSAPIAIFLLIIAGIIAWRIAVGASRNGTTGVMIHSGSSQATPVFLGMVGQATGNHVRGGWISAPLRFLRELFGLYDALDLLIGFPGPDSEALVAELGALIYDLQTRGDLARETWELPPAAS